jgi:hypothetical protein
MTIPTAPSPPPCPFVLVTIPGKGIGVLATERIPAGTLLFAELPLLLLDYSGTLPLSVRVLAGYGALPQLQKDGTLSLCSNLPEGKNHPEEDMVLGVWKVNNFCLDDEGLVNGLFLLAARLNHACVGGENCRWEWDLEEGLIRFWTDRDVEVCPAPARRMGRCEFLL